MDKDEFATDDMKSVMSKIMQLIDESEQDSPSTPPILERSYHQSIASESSVHTVHYQELVNLSKPEETQEEHLSTSIKKISSKQFLNNTLARMNNRTQKSLEQLKKTKEKVEEEFHAVCTHKPLISESSKIKAKEQTPLYERYQSCILEKNRKLSEITAKVTEEREKILEKDLTFKPKITNLDDRKRTIQQVASGCKDWKAKKVKEIEMMREKMLEDEKLNLTFKPELNHKSLEIWLKMKEENKLPEKFLNDKTKSSKFLEAQRDSKKDLLFRPKIIKSHAKLNKSCSASSVFDRLFPSGNCKLMNTLVSNPLLTSNSSLNTSLLKTDRSAILKSHSPSCHEHPSPDPHHKHVESRHKVNASISITTSYEPRSIIKPTKSEKTLKPVPKPIKKIIEKPSPKKKPAMTRSSTTAQIETQKPHPIKKRQSSTTTEDEFQAAKLKMEAARLESQKTHPIKKPQSNSITEDEFQAAKLRMEAARLEKESFIEKTNSILLSSIQEEKMKYSEIITSKIETHTATESVITASESSITASVTIETPQENTRNIPGDKIDYLSKAIEEGLLSKSVFSSYEIKNPSNIYTQYTHRDSDTFDTTPKSIPSTGDLSIEII